MSPDRSPASDMSFMEHLEALRGTMLKSALFLFVTTGLTLAFIHQFTHVMRFPLDWALDGKPEAMGALITQSPMGVFSVLLQVSLFAGIAFALPFMIYQWGIFVSPGLTKAERMVLLPAIAAIMCFFLTGVAFSFFVVLPASLKMALFLNELLGFEVIWAATSYYGLVAWLSVGIGLSFEFPVILVLLQYLRVLSPYKLKRMRRYAVVFFLVFAALITPGGDPVTLLLLATPMYGLYELSIACGYFFARRQQYRMPAAS